jgi:asparagine synthetase B (glutamine-hydrolysing)
MTGQQPPADSWPNGHILPNPGQAGDRNSLGRRVSRFERVAGTEILQPTMLEIASGVVLGQLSTSGQSAPRDPSLSPMRALEMAVLPALTRPPCRVSFSGGMDSSFVLAVAGRVARQYGLPAPIPVTWRFSNAPRAQESAWQDKVVADLKLDDWQILHADDDLDLIGPVGRRMLTRYGVRHPVNSHLHLPLLELSQGGSLLTGWGGDQVLTGWRRRRRTINAAVRAGVPDMLAATVIHRRRDPYPWLRASASRDVYRRVRSERRYERLATAERLNWQLRRRDVLMTNAGLAAVANDLDVRLTHPLLDRVFVDSLCRKFADRPGLSRSEILTSIAAGQLPESATAQRPKAHFLEVFLREPTRQFAKSWNGEGVDTALVDPDALQRLWSQWPIPPQTAGLIQHLWLSSVGSYGIASSPPS